MAVKQFPFASVVQLAADFGERDIYNEKTFLDVFQTLSLKYLDDFPEQFGWKTI